MTSKKPTRLTSLLGLAATGGAAALMAGLIAAAPQNADSVTLADEIEVLITENTIEMAASVEAGEQTFVVKNGGAEEHNLQIMKGEWKVKLEQNLAPGATGNLTATLEPGTYEVSDPISPEVEKIELRVTEPTR